MRRLAPRKNKNSTYIMWRLSLGKHVVSAEGAENQATLLYTSQWLIYIHLLCAVVLPELSLEPKAPLSSECWQTSLGCRPWLHEGLALHLLAEQAVSLPPSSQPVLGMDTKFPSGDTAGRLPGTRRWRTAADRRTEDMTVVVFMHGSFHDATLYNFAMTVMHKSIVFFYQQNTA